MEATENSCFLIPRLFRLPKGALPTCKRNREINGRNQRRNSQCCNTSHRNYHSPKCGSWRYHLLHTVIFLGPLHGAAPLRGAGATDGVQVTEEAQLFQRKRQETQFIDGDVGVGVGVGQTADDELAAGIQLESGDDDWAALIKHLRLQRRAESGLGVGLSQTTVYSRTLDRSLPKPVKLVTSARRQESEAEVWIS